MTLPDKKDDDADYLGNDEELAARSQSKGGAYVSGFKFDLFVSYAVADEEKEHGVETGWITAFMKSLESQLTKLIGRKGRLAVWRDRKELAKNAPIDPQIQ